jgi:elongation factor G
VISLKKAQEDAASLTPEYIAANMDPKEAERLSRVRNIGIAVRNQTMIVFSPRR